MTGYGEGRSRDAGFEALAELRSINHRHLKINCRVAECDLAAALEARAEQLLRTRLRRGTVTLSVRLRRQVRPEDYQINQQVLQSYLDQLRLFSSDVPVHALLALPGVIGPSNGTEEAEQERIWRVLQQAVEQALERLNAMRQQEGQAMARELRQICDVIASHTDHVESRAPQIVAAYTQRLTDRLNQMLASHQVAFSPADIVREVGVFADRIDISEELVRLRSHLDQVRSTLQQSDGSGRRLDFLVQEMFRESNTMAAKANDTEVAQRVVEIKAAIERMRELVQNVE